MTRRNSRAVLNLRSVDAKLRRAQEHAQSFERETDAWFDEDSYSLVIQSNADNTRHAIVAKLNPLRRLPPFEDWSLILADCIHNFRSALDNLVYAIAQHQIVPWPPSDKVLRGLSFVIADSPPQWRADSGRKLANLHTDVRTAIESVQPYNRWNEHRPPLLALLRDFDDFDKHRLLALTLTSPIEVNFEEITWHAVGNAPFIRVYEGPVDDGTELAVITFRRPEPDVKIHFRAEMAITVSHAPGPQGHTRSEVRYLIGLVKSEIDEVIRIVCSFVAPT